MEENVSEGGECAREEVRGECVMEEDVYEGENV